MTKNIIEAGGGANMGNVNLDSLKTAPPDSILRKRRGVIDEIPCDSIYSRIGNSYWIMTGVDWRDRRMYIAKIRILDIKAIDSAQTLYRMKFIYAFSPNASKTILTSGLDTFNLGASGVHYENLFVNRNSNDNKVLCFVGEDNYLSRGLINQRSSLIRFYDLTGKLMYTINTNNNALDFINYRKRYKGILVGTIKQ
jgi:hypothetical protein